MGCGLGWHLAAGGQVGLAGGEEGVDEGGAVGVRVEGDGAVPARQGLAEVEAVGLWEPGQGWMVVERLHTWW